MGGRVVFRVLVLAWAWPALASAQAAGEDWAGWRGPGGAGVAVSGGGSGRGLPVEWGAEAGGVKWRTPVEGRGLSSPIVVGSRVLVTTARVVTDDRRALDRGGLALSVAAGALGLLAVCGRREARAGDASADRAGAGAGRGRLAMAGLALGWVAFAAVAVVALTNHFEWMEREHAGLPRWGLLLGVLWAGCLLAWARGGARCGPSDARCWMPVGLLLASGAVLALDLSARYALCLAAVPAYAALVLSFAASPVRGERAFPRPVRDVDAALVATVTTLAVLGVAAASLRPDLYWGESIAQHVWLRASLLAAVSFWAALGVWRLGSPARLLGALALGGLAWLTFVRFPGDELGIPAVWQRRLVAIAPALVAVPWLALARGPAHRTGPLTLASSLLLVALGGWTLVRAVVLQPRLTTEQVVVCLDRETGAPAWSRVVFETPAMHLDTFRTSLATPTPASDGQRVVAYFGTGLACLDLDGRVLWKREYADYLTHSIYGAGSSPVLHGGRVFVLRESERKPELQTSALAAYDLASGEPDWQRELPHARSSYGTPVLFPPDAPTQLVSATWRAVVAYDLATGEQRWSVPLRIEEVCTSPVAGDAAIFVGGGSIVGTTAAVAPPAPGEASTGVLWQSRRGTPGCSSPVLYEGLLFTVSDTGVLTARRASDGERLWQARLPGGEYYASLFVSDGRLYASSVEGRTTVVRAASEYQPLASSELGERLLSSPAASGDLLFLRGDETLFCLAATAGGTPSGP